MNNGLGSGSGLGLGLGLGSFEGSHWMNDGLGLGLGLGLGSTGSHAQDGQSLEQRHHGEVVLVLAGGPVVGQPRQQAVSILRRHRGQRQPRRAHLITLRRALEVASGIGVIPQPTVLR